MIHFHISLHTIKILLPLQHPKRFPSTIVFCLPDHRHNIQWFQSSLKHPGPEPMKSNGVHCLLEQKLIFSAQNGRILNVPLIISISKNASLSSAEFIINLDFLFRMLVLEVLNDPQSRHTLRVLRATLEQLKVCHIFKTSQFLKLHSALSL